MLRTFVLLTSVFLLTAAVPAPQVSTLVIERQPIQKVLKYPAVVSPVIQGKLISEISGHVTRIVKHLGEKVKKGEIVFFVKNSQTAANYNEFAVRAPVAGVVSNLGVMVGRPLNAGDSGGEVVDVSQVRWVAEAPAKDLKFLKPGLDAQFETSGKIYKAKVAAISPVANMSTGTSLLELSPLEKPEELVFGTVGKTTVFLPAEHHIVVPPDSLVKLNLKKFVQKLDNEDRVHLIEVETGEMIQGQQIITKGLNPKDEIVVKSSDFLKEGDKVVKTVTGTEKR